MSISLIANHSTVKLNTIRVTFLIRLKWIDHKHVIMIISQIRENFMVLLPIKLNITKNH